MNDELNNIKEGKRAASLFREGKWREEKIDVPLNSLIPESGDWRAQLSLAAEQSRKADRAVAILIRLGLLSPKA